MYNYRLQYSSKLDPRLFLFKRGSSNLFTFIYSEMFTQDSSSSRELLSMRALPSNTGPFNSKLKEPQLISHRSIKTWICIKIIFLISGVDIIGINCRFDPDTCVDTTIRMRNAVEKAGLKCHYMVQPIAYRTADAGRLGFVELPECPLGKNRWLQ